MKRYIKIVLFAALVLGFGGLGGCREQSIVAPEELQTEGGYITFDTQGASSKGLDKSQFVKWDALELYALECATWDATQSKWFFKGQELLKGSNAPAGNWTYAPLKRWPKSNVSFFVFYPSTILSKGLISNVTSTAGSPSFDFKVPLAPIDQIDLLTAVKLNVSPSKAAVPLDFEHATARVTFSAHFMGEASITKAYVRMHSLTLAGAYSEAKLKVYDPTAAVPGVGGWSGHKNRLDYAVTVDNAIETVNIAPKPQPIVRDEYAMFMIPQPLTTQRVLADYSYSTDDGATWIRRSSESLLSDFGAYWEPGKRYNYVVAINPFSLTYDSPSATTPVAANATSVTFTVTGTKGLTVQFAKTGGDAAFSAASPSTLTCDGSAQTVTVTMAAYTTDAIRQGVYSATVTTAGLSALSLSGITVKQKGQNPSIPIGSLKWATGNLVADGKGGCKIGAPNDCGLYFQFGSLTGWSGGANGDGTGAPSTSPALAVKVGPSISWSNTSYGGDPSANPAAYDPCRKYLGSPWRMPTTNEIVSLCKGAPAGAKNWNTWAQVGGAWGSYGGVSGGYFNGTSASPTTLFFPASGYRDFNNGTFYNVTVGGCYWGSTIDNSNYSYLLYFTLSNDVIPQKSFYYRSNGFTVRCVQ